MGDKHRIEHLVTVAARDHSGQSRVELFRALNGKELFYATSEVVVEGRAMLSTPLRRLDDGSLAMLVYTSKRHPDLPETFGGTDWSNLLNIAQSLRADWMVIIGRNNDTVAITQSQLSIVSASLRESRNGYNSEPADELEQAISNAVNTEAADQYESALIQLRGREIYVQLAEETSPDGQPSLVTSAAGGINGWILTYTTRRRPGLKYGGLVWEDLVSMIKNSKDIPGVRVVNNADDWVILGRDVI
ncbi:hypothetical protein H7H51_05160 [Mycolicibacterium farcinogenes]|nr:hypothetical protein [Mycolicibacterium farcinogenes]